MEVNDLWPKDGGSLRDAWEQARRGVVEPQTVVVVRFVAPSGEFVHARRIDLSTSPPTRVDLPRTDPAVLDAAERFRTRVDPEPEEE